MPQWLKLQTEVVNVTEQRYNLHDENLLGWTVWVALTTLLKRSLVAYSLPCSQYIVFVEKLRRTQVLWVYVFFCVASSLVPIYILGPSKPALIEGIQKGVSPGSFFVRKLFSR